MAKLEHSPGPECSRKTGDGVRKGGGGLERRGLERVLAGTGRGNLNQRKSVGAGVGEVVGAGVGVVVGDAVGAGVGLGEGAGVGLAVGLAVGEGVRQGSTR